jgi:serine/threonine protein kinase
MFQKCGTPGLIAPEIVNGENYNELVDVYSIGTMAFYL